MIFEQWWRIWNLQKFGLRKDSLAAALMEAYRPLAEEAFRAGAGAADKAITDNAVLEQCLRLSTDVHMQLSEAYRNGRSNDEIADLVRRVVSGELCQQYLNDSQAALAGMR